MHRILVGGLSVAIVAMAVAPASAQIRGGGGGGARLGAARSNGPASSSPLRGSVGANFAPRAVSGGPVAAKLPSSMTPSNRPLSGSIGANFAPHTSSGSPAAPRLPSMTPSSQPHAGATRANFAPQPHSSGASRAAAPATSHAPSHSGTSSGPLGSPARIGQIVNNRAAGHSGPLSARSTTPSSTSQSHSNPGYVPPGFGFGLVTNMSAEGGALAGSGGTLSYGRGVFWNPQQGFTTGSFVTKGATVGGPHNAIGSPSGENGSSPNTVTGGYAGFGIGGFTTSASNVHGLSGRANNYNINTPAGSVSGSESNGTAMATVSVGPSLGADVSTYPSETTILSGPPPVQPRPLPGNPQITDPAAGNLANTINNLPFDPLSSFRSGGSNATTIPRSSPEAPLPPPLFTPAAAVPNLPQIPDADARNLANTIANPFSGGFSGGTR